MAEHVTKPRRTAYLSSTLGSVTGICILFATGCVHYKSRPLDPTASQVRFQSRRLDDAGLTAYAKATDGETLAWPPKTLDLTTATLVAAYYNPDLAVGRARLESAAAAVVTAGGRPNPEATGVGGYETVAESPIVLRFELSLPIETAGKRHYRILEAQEQLEVARTEFREAAWTNYAKARDSWFEYTSALRDQLIAEHVLAIRTDMVKLIEQRLSVGEVSTPEANGMRIAASQAAVAYAEATGKVNAALAQLASSMGVPGATIKGLPAADTFLSEPPSLTELPLASVQERGLLNRADVRRVQVEYAAADAHLHLELAQQYPDIRLNPGYDFEEGFHKFTFGPTIPIPVWNRNRGPIAEAEAHRTEVQTRFEATQAKAIGDVERSTALYRAALLRLHEANDKLRRLQGMQEQRTRRTVQLGQEDRLALLQAQLETSSIEHEREAALSNAFLAFAGLEDAVQASLSRIPLLKFDPIYPAYKGVRP